MKPTSFRFLKILIFNLAVFSILCSCKNESNEKILPPEIGKKSILKDYVMGPSPDFHFEVVRTVAGEDYDFHVLRMTSQNWLTSDQVDQTEWWHWVSIVVPRDTPFETGMMWIGGGSTNTKMPEKPDELILAAATQTNSIVAQVHNIPFQPLKFPGDTVERTEDAIIAYGWRKFLEGGAKDEDAIWLARLPMTKAVKLAMDATSELVKTMYQKDLKNYVVAGASKRGWTTWTTAAVDDRVVAIVPIVIDMLNLEPSFQHHWKNYGFWAPAVGNYVEEGVMEWMGTPEFDRLLEITEPYSFAKEMKLPKLLINAAGDQFFQPDSWEFYWKDLPGEKHVQYVPNFGHDLSKSDALPNMISFYASILNQTKRPDYDWKIEGDKIIFDADPNNLPISVKIWTATNENARDFRVDVFGPNWTAMELPSQQDGHYEYQMTEPEKGYQAYLMEVTYAGETPLKVTTGVEVLPTTYPFEEFKSPKLKAETSN
ncbi:PhoPQ-activated pathogenicity-related family protein [Algoriphagus pacificus]|uniref:PhoPQ-activated pathogenicity-related family protein n=1 Tax=Algoriphagus pacificus TaxID=2811234 RepID=A0ABS3CGD5_9BACT|nr:PhoPQ-activated pathogenicity-related family protein [Algoriphagus pacificus]MBN7815290.1 PhoPQ-activated pathogenicity-related family protein [Algoriphagus pacificus]